MMNPCGPVPSRASSRRISKLQATVHVSPRLHNNAWSLFSAVSLPAHSVSGSGGINCAMVSGRAGGA